MDLALKYIGLSVYMICMHLTLDIVLQVSKIINMARNMKFLCQRPQKPDKSRALCFCAECQLVNTLKVLFFCV